MLMSTLIIIIIIIIPLTLSIDPNSQFNFSNFEQSNVNRIFPKKKKREKKKTTSLYSTRIKIYRTYIIVIK